MFLYEVAWPRKIKCIELYTHANVQTTKKCYVFALNFTCENIWKYNTCYFFSKERPYGCYISLSKNYQLSHTKLYICLYTKYCIWIISIWHLYENFRSIYLDLYNEMNTYIKMAKWKISHGKNTKI